MEVFVFLLFAVVAVVSALVVILHRSPVYSVMSLVVTLLALAALFVLLGSPLLAALQILVYAGAILVLFLFVIMLLNVERDEPRSGGGLQRVFAVAGSAIFTVGLGSMLWSRSRALPTPELTEEFVSPNNLARALFSDYLLPFEMVGLLLLAAVVAATVLARRTPRGEERRR